MIVLHRRGVVDEFRNGMVFQRGSLAWDGSGRQYGVNQARFETVAGRRGVRVEEGTTNLLVNAELMDSNGDGKADNWAIDGANHLCANGEQTFTATKQYDAARQIITFTNPGPFTMSVEVKGLARLIAYLYDASGTYLGNSGIATGVENEFRRLVVTVNRSDVKMAHLRIEDNRTSGFTPITFRRPQVEMKLYATSFTSSTRSPELLTVPTAGLSPQEGTIAFWTYVDAQVRDTSTIRRFISHYNGPRANRITIQHNDTPRWIFAIGDDAGNVDSLSFEDSYTPDGWHLLAMKWSATEFAAFVDGVKLRSVVPTYLPKSLDEVFRVGHDADSTYHVNTVISDLHISSIARSDEEIFADFQRGYHVPDQYTTFYHPLDGPDSQRAARSVVL